MEWGLIWSAVDDDQLDRAVADVVASLARSSPDAISRIRQSIEVAEQNTLTEHLDLERDHQRVLIPKNMPESAAAFMEKRDPLFSGDRRDQQD